MNLARNGYYRLKNGEGVVSMFRTGLKRWICVWVIVSLCVTGFGFCRSKVVKASTVIGENIKFLFDNNVTGFTDGGEYQYHGIKKISHDILHGEGVMKLELDYSKDKDKNWSEAKIDYTFGSKITFKYYSKLSFDMIYNTTYKTTGSFKAKLFASQEGAGEINVDTEISEGEKYSTNLVKSKVIITIPTNNITADKFSLGIVGCNTDYCGEIYIDNLEFIHKSMQYVKASLKPIPQASIQVGKDSISIGNITMPVKTKVKLVDNYAKDYVASLYSYLDAIGKTELVLYGHQNDIHHKAGNKGKEYSGSDTKDVTGSYSAVVGIDTLSLTGNEMGTFDQTQSQRVKKCVKVAKEAADNGAILTLSAHMPNFELIDKRVKNHKSGSNHQDEVGYLSDGSYNFYGYTPNVISGNIVERIMPENDLNYLYTAYLDLIAEYGKELEKVNIPVLFRPFHENTGNWFWWGAAQCDAKAYKNLYRYTVTYLRDKKQVHNFLYVYSPGSEPENIEEFETRYPGDAYVDMVGFDMYHQYPNNNDNFIEQFQKQIKIVEDFAKNRNKLFAITETGIANGNEALLIAGNVRKDWYTEILNVVSRTNASYFLLWANFGEDSSFYSPYVVEKKGDTVIGHELIDNFIDFYNNNNSVFAAQTGQYKNLKVKVLPEKGVNGFIISPVSGNRILKTITLRAQLSNVDKQDTVEFVAKNQKGSVIKKIQAVKGKEGFYSGKFLKSALKDLGANIGTIQLVVNNKVYDSIDVKFNMPEIKLPFTVVDTFEGYYGEERLLEKQWSVGKGSGCSIKSKLVTDKNKIYKGKYGLKLDFILTENGYAGVVKNMNNADWSKKNALQFFTIPDGKKKKVVIQITSNGNVFEVYLNDYKEYNKNNNPILVTIPFSSFIGRDNKDAIFSAKSIDSVGLWCNSIDNKEKLLNTQLYYDEIKAVNTKSKSITFEQVK